MELEKETNYLRMTYIGLNDEFPKYMNCCAFNILCYMKRILILTF